MSWHWILSKNVLYICSDLTSEFRLQYDPKNWAYQCDSIASQAASGEEESHGQPRNRTFVKWNLNIQRARASLTPTVTLKQVNHTAGCSAHHRSLPGQTCCLERRCYRRFARRKTNKSQSILSQIISWLRETTFFNLPALLTWLMISPQHSQLSSRQLSATTEISDRGGRGGGRRWEW